MPSSLELLGLLRQIRGASSKLEKLKLAALAWRTLRGLSSEDRLLIAKELGLQGAERLVEGLSHANGISPAALLSAIHAAEDADDEQLERLVHSMHDPEQRAALAARAAGAAQSWVLSELDPEHSANPAEADELARAAIPHAGDSAPDNERAELRSEPEPDPSPTAEGAPSSLAVAAPAPPPGASPPVPTAQPVRPPAAAAPAGSGFATRPVPRKPKPEAPRPRRSSPPALQTRLTAAASLVRRLRLLDTALSHPPDLSTDQWGQVLDCFAPGWARRRALARILHTGQPAQMSSALRLIEEHSAPADRVWLLSSLAMRPRLTNEERNELIEASAGTPALARRVAHRLRRRRNI